MHLPKIEYLLNGMHLRVASKTTCCDSGRLDFLLLVLDMIDISFGYN